MSAMLGGFRDMSLKRKLIGIIMLTSSVALLMAGSVFLLYEVVQFRGSLTRELNTLAGIVGGNSTAALAFDDVETARETLSVLRQEPRILDACLYRADGTVLARYSRGGSIDELPPAADEETGVRFSDKAATVFVPITLNDKQVGTVYLKSTLEELNQKLTRYAGIVAGVLLASLLAAYLISWLLQRIISQPILNLAETASRVSTETNYTIRASVTANDEIGTLVGQFNGMLDQILTRDLALQKAQDELEDRVLERTRELRMEVKKHEETQERLLAAKHTAEEANRAKSTFLANMSHELRTPLNAILGYAEMLEEDARDNGEEEAVTDLTKIQSAGRHLLTLITDVLDISKIEAGRMELHPEVVAVRDIIQDAVNTVEPLAKRNNNRFVVASELPAETMRTDLVKFRQSLFNLLSNACKFTENGTVTLELEKDVVDGEDWISWHVRDTGAGIAAGDMGKLFQSFSQVDNSSTRKHGGTGLGLAISQRFCRMMGGDITVASEQGKGSTFTIHVPVECKAGTGEPEDQG